jgi:8-oxo-dGTP pyrophosphatase MutT (NUDIX family)
MTQGDNLPTSSSGGRPAIPGRAGAGGIPAGVFAFERAELALDEGTHPFVSANRDAIAAHWQRETAANPKLFNGRTAHFASLSLDGGVLAGRYHMVSYSAFMFWRRQPGRLLFEHVYAHAVIVSADNEILCGRMAGGTINTGVVYCPAGSFDDHDIRDGLLDIDGNMAREVREETGLDLGAMRAEDTMHAFEAANGVVLMRRYFSPLRSDELAAQAQAHIADEAEPEITEVLFLGAGSEAMPDLALQMPPILRWHFGGR